MDLYFETSFGYNQGWVKNISKKINKSSEPVICDSAWMGFNEYERYELSNLFVWSFNTGGFELNFKFE